MHSLWWEAIRKLNIVELFAGTECVSNAFRARGHKCFTVDWDEKFPSSLHMDIGELTADMILEKFGKPDVIWIAPDCRTYSLAAISKHRRKNSENGNLDPISEYATQCDKVNQHVLEVLKELNPELTFDDWRRDNVNRMIESVHIELKKLLDKKGKKVDFGK